VTIAATPFPAGPSTGVLFLLFKINYFSIACRTFFVLTINNADCSGEGITSLSGKTAPIEKRHAPRD
jgi:hypothetical protein